MNIIELEYVIREAERFISAARYAIERRDKDWMRDSKRLGLTKKDVYSNTSKENAACKRASLDLTRALAELRKGRDR